MTEIKKFPTTKWHRQFRFISREERTKKFNWGALYIHKNQIAIPPRAISLKASISVCKSLKAVNLFFRYSGNSILQHPKEDLKPFHGGRCHHQHSQCTRYVFRSVGEILMLRTIYSGAKRPRQQANAFSIGIQTWHRSELAHTFYIQHNFIL